MKYQRADIVFPPDLLIQMQKYMSDGLVYIPKSSQNRIPWGKTSGERKRLDNRNDEIRQLFNTSQKNIESLADDYHLSVETIKNIVYRK